MIRKLTAAILLTAALLTGASITAPAAEAATPCKGQGYWTFNGGRTYTYGSWVWVYPNFYAHVPGYWKFQQRSCTI